MSYQEVEDLNIMKIAEKIADDLYFEVKSWDYLDKRTVGIQLITAADSIGANIAEGYGRFHFKDSIKFIYYSRASLGETKFWLRRSFSRALIKEDRFVYYIDLLKNLAPQVNAFINAKKRSLTMDKMTR